MKYSVFIPVRAGSERVANKNTRNFAGIKGGLLALKLKQLENLRKDFEVVVSTNDATAKAVAISFQSKMQGLKINDRPDELGKSTTELSELIKYAGEVCSAESVLWTHVTSPFCTAEEYLKAIELYENKEENDSLISGRDYKEFLIEKKSGIIINNKTNMLWPRTQDLTECFEINNAIFLTSRENFKMGHRTGKNPLFHMQDRMVSLDIDTMDDFKIAEAVYDRFYR